MTKNFINLRLLAFLPAIVLLSASAQARQVQGQTPAYTLKVNSDLVLTNVVVRDKKTGKVVRGLTAKDFKVYEDGKLQHISSFDFESIDQAAALNEATIDVMAPAARNHAIQGVATEQELRDHRLIVLFFDLTSMQPNDLERAQEAAQHYIERQMQPADLVAVVSLSTSLDVNQDFTANKQLLLHAVGGYSGNEESGFEQGATDTTNQVEDTTAFTPDEEEYNDINTDRELFAIEDIAKSLAWIQEKKSLLYFSGGIQRDGIENQASLNAAVNAAVRADMSIYSVDTRGLQAISPLGDATTGNLRSNIAYSGQALQNNLDSNFNTQEVMATLSSDTGGKALFDTNNFAPAFTQIQQDTSAYYMIGYHSTDTKRDGRYRRLRIEVDCKGVKLEYRPGYYAPADFRHSNKEEREQELEDQMNSELPATDVAVYLQAMYFRLNASRYDVPISLVVPGSQIPFVQGGDRDKATFDILGHVTDAAGRDTGDVHDRIHLAINDSEHIARKNVQYNTGFFLPPGKYHLKFVVRENETGRMGSFEADITVPDLSKLPLKMSSVVIGSQQMPAPKKSDSPLVRDGKMLIPNLPHVFEQNQHLYLLYEVYDPAGAKGQGALKSRGAEHPVRVVTSIEFLHGTTKVMATPAVQATSINEPSRNAVAFQFDLPLDQLPPGYYICQVNVVNEDEGSFAFPRLALLIRSPSSTGNANPQPAENNSGTQPR